MPLQTVVRKSAPLAAIVLYFSRHKDNKQQLLLMEQHVPELGFVSPVFSQNYSWMQPARLLSSLFITPT